jgi:hypothetical protein
MVFILLIAIMMKIHNFTKYGGHELNYWDRNNPTKYRFLLSFEGFANFAAVAVANPQHFKVICEKRGRSYGIFVNILRQINTAIKRGTLGRSI